MGQLFNSILIVAGLLVMADFSGLFGPVTGAVVGSTTNPFAFDSSFNLLGFVVGLVIFVVGIFLATKK